jgi:hypothetical protein
LFGHGCPKLANETKTLAWKFGRLNLNYEQTMNTSPYKALFQPFDLGHLTLKNRIISTCHAPAYAEDGIPGERYQLYHE